MPVFDNSMSSVMPSGESSVHRRPLGGILLLDTISVDPTIQGNQEEAEIGAWNWEDEFTWPHTPLLWDEYD